MKSHAILGLIFVVNLLIAAKIHADPTDAKNQQGKTIGDVRVQDFQGYTYAYVSAQTTFSKLQETIAALMPQIDAAMDAGSLRVMGSVVFTYHNAAMDPNKPFTLDIGVMVKDMPNKPAGIQFAKVAPHCATLIYTGPVMQIQAAYEKLFAEIGQKGLKPTGITREVYLYWEGVDSPNNIVQVQAELQPDAQPAPAN